MANNPDTSSLIKEYHQYHNKSY